MNTRSTSPLSRLCLALSLLCALLLSGCAQEPAARTQSSVTLDSIPAYDGSPWVELNQNTPNFDPDALTQEAFEEYGPLDSLGRCTTAWANVCRELMPTEDRESISSVTPTGWINREYDGEYLYNRCHLIGFQLTGENANEQNLITGTRYLNVEGMLPFENMVADYVKETGNHVLYRVTPIFDGDNLVWRTRAKASVSTSTATMSSPVSPSTMPQGKAGRRGRNSPMPARAARDSTMSLTPAP